MEDVITLSSDEESPSPPRKRINPTYLESTSITIIPKKLKLENDVKQNIEEIIASANNAEVSIKPVIKDNDFVILSDEEDIADNETKSISIDANKNNAVELKDIVESDDDCMIVNENEESPLVNNESCAVNEKNKPDILAETQVESELNKIINTSKKSPETETVPTKIEDDTGEKIVSDSSSEAEELSSKENCTKSKPTPAQAMKQSQMILLETFLTACEKNVSGTEYQPTILRKFPVLRSNYKKCEIELASSPNFRKLLQENTKRAEKSAVSAVISFKEVYQHLKDCAESGSMEVPEDKRRQLKKLEKTIRLLAKKIKRLEEAEVNFDDEDDSTFLQLARYTDRMKKVSSKYCTLMNKNPNSGKLTHAKLDFADSEYNEINRAISKKYRDNKFPSYLEMENFIKKVANENNLNLSEKKIQSESSHCFKKLGELLQSRRKKELYDDHYRYIQDSEDPASKDTSLNTLLTKSYKEGLNKIDKLCEEFVTKESSGVEPNLSEEESDESDYVCSENEETNAENTTKKNT